MTTQGPRPGIDVLVNHSCWLGAKGRSSTLRRGLRIEPSPGTSFYCAPKAAVVTLPGARLATSITAVRSGSCLIGLVSDRVSVQWMVQTQRLAWRSDR